MNAQIVELRESVLKLQDAPIYRRNTLAMDCFAQFLQILETIDQRLDELEGSS